MLMPPELLEDMPRSILSRVRRGEKVDHYETRRRRKDGTIIDVSLTVSPIRNCHGIIIGASKIGRDITPQKRIEAERPEADRRKDEFLAMLAHELRNPLSPPSTGPSSSSQNLETEEDLEWAKEVVQRQVKHLARLIDDLLDVSRITRGKIGAPEGAAGPLAGREQCRRGRPPAHGGAEARAERLAGRRGLAARSRPACGWSKSSSTS